LSILVGAVTTDFTPLLVNFKDVDVVEVISALLKNNAATFDILLF
jgi:hypothetical protein